MSNYESENTLEKSFVNNHGIFSIFEVEISDYEDVFTLIKADDFIPKTSWNKSISEMVIDGLNSGKWKGLCIKDKNGKICSYLDYKFKNETIEVGVCYTDRDYRGLNLFQTLFSSFLNTFHDKHIIIGTHEKNATMINCLYKFNFVMYKQVRDRIDFSNSLHFEKHPSLQVSN